MAVKQTIVTNPLSLDFSCNSGVNNVKKEIIDVAIQQWSKSDPSFISLLS